MPTKQNEDNPPPINESSEEIKPIFKSKLKRCLPKKVQTPIKVESEESLRKEEEGAQNFNVYDLNSLTAGDAEKICEKLVDKNSILMQQLFSGIKSPPKDEFEDVKAIDINVQKENRVVKTKKFKSNNATKIVKKNKNLEVELKKRVDHDIRKAPELTVQVENNVHIQNSEIKKDEAELSDKKRVAIKIKMCSLCNTHHLQDYCSLQNPQQTVLDSLTLHEWQKRYKPLFDERCYSDSFNEFQDIDRTESNIKLSFSVMSLPSIVCIKETNNGWCVFAKEEIKSHTQFGPLIGKAVREVDIPEDSNMKDLWEIQTERYHGFINTENVEESNWIRFVRPAPTRDERNVIVVCKNDELYLVAIKNLQIGDEILYWQDSNVTSNKKKMEKTSKSHTNFKQRMHCYSKIFSLWWL